METRTHNSMNRLTAIGGSGSTVIEGSVNEFARVTVNGASAQLSKDPVGDGFRYRRTEEKKEKMPGIWSTQGTVLERSGKRL